MSRAATKPVPSCLRHFGTSWVLISQDKAACVMDYGSADVVRRTRELVDRGEVRSIEGLWITHYHDDHVDFVPEFLEAFPCPCITDGAVAQVITDPLAWRLPCISPKKAQVDRVTCNGESWRWHEFKMTAYHLPAQTLYHSGLLVEGQRTRMLFVGDSFTPAGIEDYCAQNRCWLEVVVTHHSAGERTLACRPVPPRAWNRPARATYLMRHAPFRRSGTARCRSPSRFRRVHRRAAM